jgi:hypothetical protein
VFNTLRARTMALQRSFEGLFAKAHCAATAFGLRLPFNLPDLCAPFWFLEFSC